MSIHTWGIFSRFRRRRIPLARRPQVARLSLESLEQRRLLAIDGANAWHNAAMPADVNADGHVTAFDALALINELNASGARQLPSRQAFLASNLRAASATVEGGGAGAELYLDINNDGYFTAYDALSVINQLNETAEAKVAIRLRATDLSGNPITQIEVGQSFQLRGFVDDVRPTATTPGVWAAYTDVTWQSTLAQVNGTITYGIDYPNGHVGNPAADPGLLNEIGAFAGFDLPDGDETLLFIVPMHAALPGTINFVADPADGGPTTAVVMSDQSVTAQADVMYGTASLLVVGPPAISIGDVTETEGNAGDKTFTFTVNLSRADDADTTVQFNTAAGTATLGDDFDAASGTLTFVAGETSKTISVTVHGDAKVEANDTFTVTLTNPTNGVLEDAEATGVITNDDQYSFSIDDVAVVENANGGNAQLIYTVTRSGTGDVAATVDFQTALGSAQSSDFAGASGMLTFAANETSRTIIVDVIDDALDEDDETVLVNLSNPTNAIIADPQGAGTITDDDAAPELSATTVFGSLGEGSANPAKFVVGLPAPSGKTITVHYSIGGTATVGDDYSPTGASGTLTFLPGEMAKFVDITVLNDSLDEPAETLVLTLDSPTNATLNPQATTATITIEDNDKTVSIDDASAIVEGTGAATELTFTVRLSSAHTQTVTVNYATSNGTAAAPGDYAATSGTVTFLAGEIEKTITVPVVADTNDDADTETVLVTLTNPMNAAIADGSASGAITDDDAAPTISIADPVAIVEGDTGTSVLTFVVSLSNSSDQQITVDFETAAGTALAGADFAAANGTITFAPGQTTKDISINVVGDLNREQSESFQVRLKDASANATIADSEADATITDNDPAPTISVANVSVAEGNSGTKDLTFTVMLSAATFETVTLDYAAVLGSAEADDFAAALPTGSLTFAPGDPLTKTITLTVNGDTAIEGDETVALNLSNVVNATPASLSATGTITDDDGSLLSINDAAITETNANVTLTFTVTLSQASTQQVKVDFEIVSGTALVGSDFALQTGTLTFAPGETTKTIVVSILGDTVHEATTETFTVHLSNPTGNATIADADGTGTITDNDPVPTLAITGAAATDEGDASGTKTVTYTVTLSNPTFETVTVNYGTSDGTNPTATAGSDYVAASGTLTFAPGGPLTRTFTVTINSDNVDELNENYKVALTNPVGATLASGQGELQTTITDNDATPILSIADASTTEGDEFTKVMKFLVTLSHPSSRNVTFIHYTDVATGSDMATAGEDYEEIKLNQALMKTIPAGETQLEVSITIFNDTVSEANERFLHKLTGATNATTEGGDDTAVGTILDNEGPALVITGPATQQESQGVATYTVTLTKASTQTVTVNYATEAGTATAGADFIAQSGTLTFEAGELTKTIEVSILNDAIDELDEKFGVRLSNATNAPIQTALAETTIKSDDLPTISIGDASVIEGDSGELMMSFTVTLSHAPLQEVTVQYATAGATGANLATAGTDYEAISASTIKFDEDQLTQTIAVKIKGDTLSEAHERFLVKLSQPVNATIADGEAVGTIEDNEAPALVITGTPGVVEQQGTTTYTVSLTRAVATPVTVNFATESGTATAVQDFGPTSGTLTFLPGELTKTITVGIVNDTVDEADQAFRVRLSNASGATIQTDSFETTISDNDAAPTLSIADASIVEGDGGTQVMTFTVTLSAASEQQVKVKYGSTGVTAVETTDFQDVEGELTFNPGGPLTQTISVTIQGDTALEPNETFTVDLSLTGITSPNATLADASAVGTIIDDDTPSFSGYVYADLNGNGVKDAHEQGIAGVMITLAGMDTSNSDVNRTVMTDANGFYSFAGLETGFYRLTEMQPSQYTDGADRLGNGVTGGGPENDVFIISLAAGDQMTDTNFGEAGLTPDNISKANYLASRLRR